VEDAKPKSIVWDIGGFEANPETPVSTRRFGQHGQDYLSKVSAKLPVTDPDSVNGSDYTRGGNA